eukprot:m.59802 g.59802  ORF g.59802 m.59802 type:complete len:665 (-) comp11275_c0_seq1:127-2121(-)
MVESKDCIVCQQGKSKKPQSVNNKNGETESRTFRKSTVGYAVALVLALMLARFGTGPTRLSTKIPPELVLGHPAYNVKIIESPVASGLLLRILAYTFETQGIGPLIIRTLLNNNQFHELRIVASQVPVHVPSVFLPMERLAHETHDRHAKSAITAPTAEFLQLVDESLKSGTGKVNTVQSYANAYRSGSVTPVDVARRFLAALKSENMKKLGTVFVTVLPDEVIRQAEASTARFQAGKPLGILDGVPIAIKDMLPVKGHPITEGLRMDHAHPPQEEDDPIVERFREQGAIILGTTVMPEYGVTPLGYSSIYQGPRNPHNPNKFSGGSSSGSAVAVAMGLAPIAVGFDAGGSIRVPSSMSGIVGLMTSWGRIPTTRLMDSATGHAGPMAATARDAAIGYAVMTQKDDVHDQHSQLYSPITDVPAAHMDGFSATEDLKDVRLGIFWDNFLDGDSEISDAALQAVRLLEKRGAVLVNISVPHYQQLSFAHVVSVTTEFAAHHDKEDCGYLEPNTRITLAIGGAMTSKEYLAAKKLKGWTIQYLRDMYKKHSLTAIVNPTVGIKTPELEDHMLEYGINDGTLVIKVMRNIFLANIVGFPAVTVPVGYSTESLPIGLQFMGFPWDDTALLRLAHATETAVGLESLRTEGYIDLLAADVEQKEEDPTKQE